MSDTNSERLPEQPFSPHYRPPYTVDPDEPAFDS